MSGGGGLGGIVAPIFGGNDSANAAQGAALAQQHQARLAYNETKNIVNPATTQGLASYDRDIANQEKNLSRQEQLISQIDPTIIEASQQALKLLRGENSSVLAPLQNQRNLARQKLVNQLREQLGPGAETSTAGIQALNRFDSETSSLTAGAQQQALQNIGGVANQFNSTRPDMLRDIMGLSQLGQGKTNLSYQQAAALSNARQGLQQTAGAQFTGQAIQGAQGQAYGNQLFGAGVQAGTAALMGGAPKPGPSQQAGQSYLNTSAIA